jgi:RNA polymerase sigma-70 factor (subfamily 1)
MEAAKMPPKQPAKPARRGPTFPLRREIAKMPPKQPGGDRPPDGFNDLVTRYGDYLRHLARLRVDPRLHALVDPSGIANETLMKAFQAWGTFQYHGEDKLQAWLRTILKRTLIDRLRQIPGLCDQSLNQPLGSSSSMVEAWLADPGSSPSDQVLQAEEQARLDEALRLLSQAQQEAVTLRYYHGWSRDQIAHYLGRTPDAVAGLIKRGLQKLREQLKPLKDGD